MKPPTLWTTRDEIAFLRRLGMHRPAWSWRETHDRETLLRTYQRGMARRQDWGRIDREAVAKALRGMLNT